MQKHQFGPPKVLASRKMRQVGGITSAERGPTFTMMSAVDAVGNNIPPMIIFPELVSNN